MTTCSHSRSSDSDAVSPETSRLQLPARRSSTVPRRTCVTTRVVTIIKTASSLTGSNGGTLAFTPTGQATATLPNSGALGVDFFIGGDIDIVPATVDGTYSGNINVTVDYQ